MGFRVSWSCSLEMFSLRSKNNPNMTELHDDTSYLQFKNRVKLGYHGAVKGDSQEDQVAVWPKCFQFQMTQVEGRVCVGT